MVSVCGKARSTTALRTVDRPPTRCSTEVPSTPTRLLPWYARSSVSTWEATVGDAPRTSMRCTANIEVPRASAYIPATAAIRPSPTAIERPDGMNRARSAREWARLLVRSCRACSAMRLTSPRGPAVLPAERRQLERPQEHDLVLELDAVLLRSAPTGLGHQRNRVRGSCAVGVLDEVRVPRGDLGAADSVSPQPARLEHPPRGELVVGILEDAAVRPLVRRLRGLSAGLELADRRSDLIDRPR